MRKVLFVERRLAHYRVPFFDTVRQMLLERGVEFVVAIGEPTAAERLTAAQGELEWAQRLPVTRYAFNDRICWQPFETRGSDLVIVSQENGLIFNHWLCRPWRDFKLAFFGHGANMGAAGRTTLRESFKRYMARHADWWFAYTRISHERVTAAGYPAERVTVFNNTVDTEQLRRQAQDVSATELAELRRSFGLTAGKTAIYVGTLTAAKFIGDLVEAGRLVHHRHPSFRLLVVGDGNQAPIVRAVADSEHWLHWFGAKRGREKAALMSVADLIMMPGAVGLAILDGFTLNLPMVTRDRPGHGPEIAYLRHGENGLLTPPSTEAFAAAVANLIGEAGSLDRMRAAAAADGLLYSIKSMSTAFTEGVMAALAAPPLRAASLRKEP